MLCSRIDYGAAYKPATDNPKQSPRLQFPKATCVKGHLMTPENTYFHSRTGYMRCRICREGGVDA